ncbi:catabolite gene activator protein [Chitiniphilus shinanonensis]|uniref:Catabolite gene activator protein n=1 Tax=Chitiniphilus shinanonensis TaxID=553088 RepID=A0ABQ6BRH1_9NEIS|nr:Crp/Fnr family transcriptional regulator [Chitiniphilus shinanonensis]GLS04600.1 catabolite gene activator protein [Chitiniphilus shinanonensis]
MNKARLLSGSTLFCELSEQELEELAQHAELREVRAKQTVVQQGTAGEEMYAVLHGRLKVSRNTEDGREATLCILEAGEVFGEIAMLDGGMRSASVEALEACELLVLRRDAVMGYLESHPKVMRQLIAALCERLRAADNLLQDMLFLNLPERLGKMLRQLGEAHGTTEADGSILIDLKLTQQELANLVGASRESVNKQLNAWVEQDWVALEHGYIRLLKVDSLPG